MQQTSAKRPQMLSHNVWLVEFLEQDRLSIARPSVADPDKHPSYLHIPMQHCLTIRLPATLRKRFQVRRFTLSISQTGRRNFPGRVAAARR